MKNVILLIIILFTIQACKPIDPEDEIIQYKISEEVKAYFGNFKEGSWWAYQDTVTGVIDTFRLINNYGEVREKCYYLKEGKEVYGSRQSLRMKWGLSNINPYLTYFIGTDCSFPEETYVEINFGAAMGKFNVFFNEEEGFINNWININGDTIKTYYYSTFILNNVSYEDVYYIENDISASFYSEYSYLISKNIGIIGFNTKNDFDNNWKAYWVLIDKNIVL